ncbi:hypothetical protein LCGC14_2243600 [marine sediment metagenome]|uniref:Uncharacterized protein n=1 Tax=marine sediment metagenome TaxID=412755 RepID=A0A0F9FH70_9ZZZZ
MKISELTRTWDVIPRIAHVHQGDVVHIVERKGEYKPDKYRRNNYDLTNCNRLIKWTWSTLSLIGYKLCSKCGDRKAFEDALERGKILRAEVEAEDDRQRIMGNAEFLADVAWDQTYQEINDGIAEYADELVKDGKVLIPINEVDLEMLRFILKRFMAATEFQPLKPPELVQDYHHVKRILDEVLIT